MPKMTGSFPLLPSRRVRNEPVCGPRIRSVRGWFTADDRPDASGGVAIGRSATQKITTSCLKSGIEAMNRAAAGSADCVCPGAERGTCATVPGSAACVPRVRRRGSSGGHARTTCTAARCAPAAGRRRCRRPLRQEGREPVERRCPVSVPAASARPRTPDRGCAASSRPPQPRRCRRRSRARGRFRPSVRPLGCRADRGRR